MKQLDYNSVLSGLRSHKSDYDSEEYTACEQLLQDVQKLIDKWHLTCKYAIRISKADKKVENPGIIVGNIANMSAKLRAYVTKKCNAEKLTTSQVVKAILKHEGFNAIVSKSGKIQVLLAKR